jgi:hypothetical protein
MENKIKPVLPLNRINVTSIEKNKNIPPPVEKKTD